MLRHGVAAADPVAALGYAALHTARVAPADAEAVLTAAARTADGEFLVAVGQALTVLTGDPGWTRLLLPVLAGDPRWGTRVAAALALAAAPPTGEAADALARAVGDDEDYLVRYHAANALLRYAGRRRPDVSTRPALFEPLCRPAAGVADDRDRAGWRAVAARLRAAVLL
jgi:hypothetical protein